MDQNTNISTRKCVQRQNGHDTTWTWRPPKRAEHRVMQAWQRVRPLLRTVIRSLLKSGTELYCVGWKRSQKCFQSKGKWEEPRGRGAQEAGGMAGHASSLREDGLRAQVSGWAVASDIDGHSHSGLPLPICVAFLRSGLPFSLCVSPCASPAFFSHRSSTPVTFSES